jgi:hypothetical protein
MYAPFFTAISMVAQGHLWIFYHDYLEPVVEIFASNNFEEPGLGNWLITKLRQASARAICFSLKRSFEVFEEDLKLQSFILPRICRLTINPSGGMVCMVPVIGYGEFPKNEFIILKTNRCQCVILHVLLF